MLFNNLKRRQVGSTPDFRRIINDPKALKRVNDYIAAKNKWLKVKSPRNITPEEIKLANALEEQLFEFVPDFRYHRFLEFYHEHNGDINKIMSEIPDAPKVDIKTAIGIYESQGAGRLRAYLDTRTWGVIESGFEPHYVVNPKLAVQRLRISFATGRFKVRSGVEFYPADMDVVQRVDRYTRQMLNFNMRPYIRKLEQVYQDAIPKLKNPIKVQKVLSMSANEMMGYVERGGMMYDIIVRIAAQAYTTVFGTMPVLPFRNLFQNLAFATDKSVLIDPRNRKLTQEEWIFYRTYVSQMEAIPRDLMLAEERGIPGIDRVNRFIHRLNIYGASDSKVNRVWLFWGHLNKAERALKGFRADGNVEKFISNSGMAELTLGQQTDILRWLATTQERSIRETALELVNNVHLLYDRAQRAPIEMGGIGRIFGSLLVFPRGVLQRIIYQFKPLDPQSWAPVAKKKRALKVLFAVLWGSIVANYLFQKATGRRDAPYNPLNILRWSPGGLAIGSVTAITDVIGTTFMAMSGSEWAKSELPAHLERAGDTMIPFYKVMMQSLEVALEKKYIDRLAYREVRSIIDKKLWEMGFLDKKEEDLYVPNKAFYEAERSWEWRIKHALFGTEPKPDPLRDAIKKTTEGEGKLGQFVMAEDSDDGYVYEMSDFASTIGQAIQNLKLEDVTEENGFSPLVVYYKEAERLWDTYYYSLPGEGPFRANFFATATSESVHTGAALVFWGKLKITPGSYIGQHPETAALVRSLLEELIEKYGIPEGAIPAFEALPTREPVPETEIEEAREWLKSLK